MRNLLTSTAIALLALTGAAAGARGDELSQTYNSEQTISQVARAASELLNQIDALVVSAGPGGAVSQSGLNAANIVQSDGHLANANQFMNGIQRIDNIADTVVQSDEITQSGTNVTGVLKADTIENAVQYFGSDAVQWVKNAADVSDQIGVINQSGMNAANIAIAEFSIGSGTQILAPGSLQKIKNVVTFDAAGAAGEINQDGTNLGNIMVSSKVKDVTRIFNGTQVVDNTVYLADANTAPINQSGLNIANFVQADVIGTVTQYTTGGSQNVRNRVIGPDGKEIKAASWLNQESTNLVNVMVIGGVTSTGGSDGVINASQTSNYPQTSSGIGPQSQSGNVMAINR